MGWACSLVAMARSSIVVRYFMSVKVLGRWVLFWTFVPMIRKNPVILRIVEELVAGGQLGQAIQQRHFPKGHLLFEQGVATANVYFIRSGVVKCSFAEDRDKEYILEFLGEGEVLGENEAICKTVAMSTVRSISELSVYMMDKATFLDLLARHAAFNFAILELLAVRVTNTATRSARQQLNTLEHNLANLLEVLEAERLPCTKQELADYLGITLRSLNRLSGGRFRGTRPGV
jgi:CRP-like cAMP-binding protein